MRLSNTAQEQSRKAEQIRRSKQWLGDALLELLAKESIDRISVSDICDRAGVGRQSFYRYFTSKEDLLTYRITLVFARFRKRIEVAFTTGSRPELVELEAFRVAMEEKHMIELIKMRKTVRRIFLELVVEHRRQLEKDLGLFADGNDYKLEYRIGGISHVLIKWLEDGMKESPEAMSEIFRQLFAGE